MLTLQIKLLFQTGFDEGELKSYVPVIHANVYQTIKVCTKIYLKRPLYKRDKCFCSLLFSGIVVDQLLHDGTKEFAQNETDPAKYTLSSENMVCWAVFLVRFRFSNKIYAKSPYYYQTIGEKLSEIGARLDYPCLTKDLAEGIETLWNDPAIQVCVCVHVFFTSFASQVCDVVLIFL